MKKNKHTPGPWLKSPGEMQPIICVDGDPEWPIVVQVSGHSDEGIEANIALICAAPDMLEALEEASEHIRECLGADERKGSDSEEIWQNCCAAIKKAKGEK